MFGKIKKLKSENEVLIAENGILEDIVRTKNSQLKDKDKEIRALKFRLESPPKYKVGKKFDWGKIISVDLVEPTNIFKDSRFHQLVALDLFKAMMLEKNAVASDELKQYVKKQTKYDWLYKFQLTTGEIMEVTENEIENVNK
jgi:hypothetical protein